MQLDLERLLTDALLTELASLAYVGFGRDAADGSTESSSGSSFCQCTSWLALPTVCDSCRRPVPILSFFANGPRKGPPPGGGGPFDLRSIQLLPDLDPKISTAGATHNCGFTHVVQVYV